MERRVGWKVILQFGGGIKAFRVEVGPDTPGCIGWQCRLRSTASVRVLLPGVAALPYIQFALRARHEGCCFAFGTVRFGAGAAVQQSPSFQPS